MPRSLSPIPAGVAITEPNTGIITIFFRLAWQLLVDGFQITPTRAAQDLTNQSAAVVTATLFTPEGAGTFRFSYALAKTIADGVSSSTQVTIGWTENGVAKTHVFAAFVTDSVIAVDAGTWLLHADGNAPITWAVVYASNTPNRMTFDVHPVLEQMA